MKRADLACAAAIAALGAALSAAGPAHAQRAAENVVRQATDAFGISVGNEKIGLYTDDNVRGFNPTLAGNIRLDGLYIDRRAVFSPRLVQGSTVRVGLAAQGYDFPAPSGIVDFNLRRPTTKGVHLSLGPYVDTWGSRVLEGDLGIKLNDKLSIQAGFADLHEEIAAGVGRNPNTWGALVDYTPVADWRISAFASGSRLPDDTAISAVFTGGAFLPPYEPSRNFYGQDWANASTRLFNGGMMLNGRRGNTILRAGVFYSDLKQLYIFSDQYLNATLAGTSGHTMSTLKDQDFSSISGEVRLGQSFTEGPRRHTVLASLRFRERDDEYGGAAQVDLGPARIGTNRQLPEPVFNYGPRTQETLTQRMYGVSYQGVWPGRGELNAGLQKVSYSREIVVPATGFSRTEEPRWLYNLNGAVNLTPWAVAFGGYTRGIEDAGVSPGNSANPNVVLAPVASKQLDFGVRLVSGRIRLVADVFRIVKPVYALDTRNVFTIAGDVESTGFELSLTATVRDDLRAVGGLVLAKPRVERAGVKAPPVAAVDSMGLLSLEYTPRGQQKWSFDLNLNYSGRKAARNDGSLFIPPQLLAGVGSRYRFKLPGGGRATLRTSLTNIFDKRAWNVLAGQGFVPVGVRKLTVTLLADF